MYMVVGSPVCVTLCCNVYSVLFLYGRSHVQQVCSYHTVILRQLACGLHIGTTYGTTEYARPMCLNLSELWPDVCHYKLCPVCTMYIQYYCYSIASLKAVIHSDTFDRSTSTHWQKQENILITALWHHTTSVQQRLPAGHQLWIQQSHISVQHCYKKYQERITIHSWKYSMIYK